MPEAFYLEVYRHQLAGRSVTDIAAILETSTPTVRRAIKRCDDLFVKEAATIHRILFDTLREYCPELHEPYYYAAVGVSYTMTGMYPFNIKDFYGCFTNCPSRFKMREHCSLHLKKLVYKGESYQFTFSQPIDPELSYQQIAKTDACGFCSLGMKKGNIYQPMIAQPHIYYDLLFYLSLYRTSPEDSDMIATGFDHAFDYSIVSSILLKILQKAHSEGQDEKTAVARIEEYFIGFTQHLWDCVT